LDKIRKTIKEDPDYDHSDADLEHPRHGPSMASSSVPAASTDVDGDHQHQQPHARPPHVMAMAAKESTLVDF
jgi:hypothetical protein